MNAVILGLTIFPAKGEPGVSVPEMNLTAGLGVEGDFHQGGERQVALLSAEARRWIEGQPEQGLCFGRFRENILIEGLPLELLTPGRLLSVGSAALRISAFTKPCFDECTLAAKGKPCKLSGRALFAAVERGGTIRLGDEVYPLPEDDGAEQPGGLV